MQDLDPLISQFSHEKSRPREKEALLSLQKIASLVKPIMRARSWRVGTLAEFYPDQTNLLGLNYDHGQKICLRLRYPGDANQFLPMEQVVDTMLHELSHIVHGPHDEKFHALWDQLRSEYEALVRKGYSGEGFLSEGRRLGGRSVPRDEARRIARTAAEKRRNLTAGSGQKLGGTPLRVGQDIRQVIVSAIERRATITKGCGSGNKNDSEVKDLADRATNNGFKTKADEDMANQRAIEQAMWELIQEDEQEKFGASYIPPSAANPSGSSGDRAPTVNNSSNPFDALVDHKLQSQTPIGSSNGFNASLESESSKSNSGYATSVMNRGANPFNALLDGSGSSKPRAGPAHNSRLINLQKTKPEQSSNTAGRTLKQQPPSKKQRLSPAPPADREWICSICTCHNPETFLCCDACSTERPFEELRDHVYGNDNRPKDKPYVPAPKTWTCHLCTTKMEEQWWTCSTCGVMKLSS